VSIAEQMLGPLPTMPGIPPTSPGDDGGLPTGPTSPGDDVYPTYPVPGYPDPSYPDSGYPDPSYPLVS
jgi:hypothetical protein